MLSKVLSAGVFICFLLPFTSARAENEIGLMLPCNVIVYVDDNSETIVAAIDPVASMQAISNPKLNEIANAIRGKLKSVIERI